MDTKEDNKRLRQKRLEHSSEDETEKVALNIAMRNNYVKAKICRTQENSKCGLRDEKGLNQ